MTARQRPVIKAQALDGDCDGIVTILDCDEPSSHTKR